MLNSNESFCLPSFRCCCCCCCSFMLFKPWLLLTLFWHHHLGKLLCWWLLLICFSSKFQNAILILFHDKMECFVPLNFLIFKTSQVRLYNCWKSPRGRNSLPFCKYIYSNRWHVMCIHWVEYYINLVLFCSLQFLLPKKILCL